MVRLIAALAFASLSSLASAADKPLPVTVTNPVLPVEVSNAESIPVVAPTLSTAAFFSSGGGFGSDDDLLGQGFVIQPAVLTGLLLVLRAEGTTGTCTLSVRLIDGNVSRFLALGLATKAGEILVNPMIPLPNLAVPAGTALEFVTNNETASRCDVQYTLHGRNQ